jgi:uncharacterized protein (TIGR02246 family)
MRKLLLFLVLLGVFASSTLWPQAAPATGDEAAARDVVARYMQARNQKDEVAVRSLFTPDADQLVSSGEWRKGIDNLVRGAMASSQKETGSSSISVESVRFLEPDIAIVDGRYRTTSSTRDVRNMWTTLVLKRTRDGWKITAIRNMLPAPARP